MISDVQLTASEQEQVRQQAIRAMQKRLEIIKPDVTQYVAEMPKMARWIDWTLQMSKAIIPVIALLAALASSVRTLQAVSEVYTASGSHAIGVGLAAFSFTISVEVCLFVVALASENERMNARRRNQPRRVFTLLGVWQGLMVRIGIREPLSYAEMEESINLFAITALAFTFAIVANTYLGLRPILSEIGAVSLQDFVVSLWDAPASLQMTFILDFISVLFPPAMSLAAGHLTAKFAAEITEESRGMKQAYEQALETWQKNYMYPLNTDEGQELLEAIVAERLHRKSTRRKFTVEPDFLLANGKSGS